MSSVVALIQRSLARVRNIWLANLLATSSFLFAGIVLAAALKRQFFVSSTYYSFLLAIVAVLGFALIAFFLLRNKASSAKEIAQILDQQTSAKERFLTVATLAESKTSEPHVLREVEKQAQQFAMQFDHKLAFPFRFKRIALSCLVFASCFFIAAIALLAMNIRGPLAPSEFSLAAGASEAQVLREFIAQQQSLPNDVESKFEELAEQLEQEGLLAPGLAENIEQLQKEVASEEQKLEVAQMPQDQTASKGSAESETNPEATRQPEQTKPQSKEANEEQSQQAKQDEAKSSDPKQQDKQGESKPDSAEQSEANQESTAQDKPQPSESKEEQQEKDEKAKEKEDPEAEQEKDNEAGVGEGKGEGKSGAGKQQHGETQSGEDDNGAKDDPSAKNNSSAGGGEQKPDGGEQKKEPNSEDQIESKPQPEKQGGGKDSSAEPKQGGEGENKSELEQAKDKLSELEQKVNEAQKQEKSQDKSGEKPDPEQKKQGDGKQDPQEKEQQQQEGKQGEKPGEEKEKQEQKTGQQQEKQQSKENQAKDESPSEAKQSEDSESKDEEDKKESGKQKQGKSGDKPKEDQGDGEKEAGDNESASSQNGKPKPSPEGSVAKQGPLGGEDGEGEGLAPETKFEKVEIPKEQIVNPFGVGAEDTQRYENPEDAKLRTKISEKEFVKPEAKEARTQQKIPVEYIDLLE